MKKHDIIILHGTGGSPDGNWFPWLKNKLTARPGHNVYVPRMPTPDGQSVDIWRAALAAQVPQPFANDPSPRLRVTGAMGGKPQPLEKLMGGGILIGHSCGATFMLHLLEKLNAPVAQSIFVSGFIDKLGNEFFDTLNETFVNHEFDWEKIKKNTGKITLFYGDNDPYVPPAAARKLADNLGTPLTVIPNGGHLNAEFGYTEFPKILEVIK
ncbi:MAG: alpha/beta hydrolase [Proteobacteria bacterium]|nr:alpha/beta hydrolase [Pseudomonadota bacterium]